jgi:hypothetical protein
MEPPAFFHFNAGQPACRLFAAEKILEVKYVTRGAGHVQFFGIYDLFHGIGFGDRVKLENKILFRKPKPWKHHIN